MSLYLPSDLDIFEAFKLVAAEAARTALGSPGGQ